MNCSGYERQMSDYLDGQLSKAAGDKLRFHLNGCPRCRLKIEDMESSIRAVKSLPSVSPRQKFDHQLSNLLNREIAREMYAASWWRRVSAAFADLGELSRQRPVQLVFATSLILTITGIGGFAELSVPPENPDSSQAPPMALTLPAPFEPELAPPDPVSPFPLDRTPGLHMAARPAPNQEQATNLPTSSVNSLPLNATQITGNRPGIMTVRTMEPTTHGIRFVSAGTGMRLDPALLSDSLGRDLVTDGNLDQAATENLLHPAGTGEFHDSQRTGVSANSSGTQGSSGPTAPLRRVRISF